MGGGAGGGGIVNEAVSSASCVRCVRRTRMVLEGEVNVGGRGIIDEAVLSASCVRGVTSPHCAAVQCV